VPTKRRVLIADVPEAHNAIARCLPGRTLHFAETLEAAKLELVQRPFHLVIIGLQFDGSRLFKLLDYLRANGRFGEVPVVCVQTRPSMLPPQLHGAIQSSLKVLGARALVPINGRNHDAVCKFLGALADGQIPTAAPGAAKRQ
jgi:hypothetical protein